MTPERLKQVAEVIAARRVNLTLEEARDFVASVGLCLLYPLQPPVLLPTFLGAWLGADHNVPGARQAFAEPRAREA